MTTLSSFLAWFDGFAENIKKQPTPEQWSRVCARVDELRSTAPDEVEAAYRPPPVATTPAPAERMKKPSNDREWRAQFIGALCEFGVDMDSAKDIASTEAVDLSRDPKAAAKAVLAQSGALN